MGTTILGNPHTPIILVLRQWPKASCAATNGSKANGRRIVFGRNHKLSWFGWLIEPFWEHQWVFVFKPVLCNFYLYLRKKHRPDPRLSDWRSYVCTRNIFGAGMLEVSRKWIEPIEGEDLDPLALVWHIMTPSIRKVCSRYTDFKDHRAGIGSIDGGFWWRTSEIILLLESQRKPCSRVRFTWI